MPEPALGQWLRWLRDDRSLSLREVAARSDVDHAYIYRLETGAKEAPSDDVINRLITALAPVPRDTEILRFLAKRSDVDSRLALFARQDTSVTPDELHMLTTVRNRGTSPDYAVSLERIRRIMLEDDDG